MNDSFELVVVGDVNPDLVLTAPDLRIEFDQHETLVESGSMTLGGSSAITACGAARLGIRTAFVGLIGNDAFGVWCRERLDACGVDTSMLVTDPTVDTGVTVILQRSDDRAIVTSPGSIAQLDLSHIDVDRLCGARHVHVGSYFLQTSLRPSVSTLFDRVRAAGATTSLDTNYDPADVWALGDVLSRCDMFFPNDAEARRFGGSDDLDDAVATLGRDVAHVAVTCGAAGGLVHSAGSTHRADAPAIDGVVVDAVGAGDSFDAGFIAGHLRGLDAPAALRLGLGAASLSVRGRGGIDRQGTYDEAARAGGVSP